jgi:hypothetical protein
MIMSSIIVTHFVCRRFAIPASFATRSRTLLYLPLVALRGNLLYRASHTLAFLYLLLYKPHVFFFLTPGSIARVD